MLLTSWGAGYKSDTKVECSDISLCTLPLIYGEPMSNQALGGPPTAIAALAGAPTDPAEIRKHLAKDSLGWFCLSCHWPGSDFVHRYSLAKAHVTECEAVKRGGQVMNDLDREELIDAVVWDSGDGVHFPLQETLTVVDRIIARHVDAALVAARHEAGVKA